MPNPQVADKRLAFGRGPEEHAWFPYAPKEAVPWQRTGRASRAARRRSRRVWQRPARTRWARPVARPPGRVAAAMVLIRAKSARVWRRPARGPGPTTRARRAGPRAA